MSVSLYRKCDQKGVKSATTKSDVHDLRLGEERIERNKVEKGNNGEEMWSWEPTIFVMNGRKEM